jgi:hypothetical protein
VDDPSIRTAVVAVGMIFWLAFAGMTAVVIGDAGATPLTVAAVVIVVLTGVPLLSALRDPPNRRR